MTPAPCVESSVDPADDTHFAATVAGLSAAGSVVVGVSPADRRAAREALPEHTTVLALPALEGAPPDEVARGVLAVDGRCVVLARRDAGGWQVRVTAGLPPATVDAPPLPAAPRPALRPAHGAWLAGAVAVGVPNVVSAMASVRAGPFVAEVAVAPLFPFGLVDLSWRVGPVVPVHPPAGDAPVHAVGVLAGAAMWASVLAGGSGPTFALAFDRYRPRGPRSARLLRVTAGLDVWTDGYLVLGEVDAFDADRVVAVPRVQVAFGGISAL